MGQDSGAHLGELSVSDDCACADKHEEHEVQQEYYEGSDLERQAFGVVGKVVDKGRNRPSTHDHGMPNPCKMPTKSSVSNVSCVEIGGAGVMPLSWSSE